jgi:hypothetical protein
MTQPPNWCSDAIPTSRGWMHPTSGEILISNRVIPNAIKFEDALEELVKTGKVSKPGPVKHILQEVPVENLQYKVLEEVVEESVKPSRRRKH